MDVSNLPEQVEKTLAWARYLFWADLNRKRFENHLLGAGALEHGTVDFWHSFALSAQWFASEYVVVDGWRAAEFSDGTIDELLRESADLVDLLRRFRNAVFHYQPRVLEAKYLDLLERAPDVSTLVGLLHDEFVRYYWEFSTEQEVALRRDKWEQVATMAIGWIPSDLPEARAAQVQREMIDIGSAAVARGASIEMVAADFATASREAQAAVAEFRMRTTTFLEMRRNLRRNDA